MRYDNDVKAERRGIREQVANFVRTHLTNPRRAAVLGVAAAVGTGALAFTAAPQPADAGSPKAAQAVAAVTQTQNHRADAATVTRSLDRTGKPVIKVAAKKAAAGKNTPGKPTRSANAIAADKTQAMINTKPVAGLDKTQMKNAALIVKAGQDLGISERGQIVAVATAMQESNLYNRASNVVPESLKYDHQGMGSDYDSVGLFQQRYTTGWGTVKSIMNPSESAKKFYKALKQVHGWQKMPITVAAQTVQGSAFPDAYAKHQGNATTVVKAVNKTAAQH